MKYSVKIQDVVQLSIVCRQLKMHEIVWYDITHMKNTQKGFVRPLIIVLIAVLVVVGEMYFINSRKAAAPVVVDTEVQRLDQIQQQVDKAAESVTSQQQTTDIVPAKVTTGIANMQPILVKKFFDDYRFSISYPKTWTVSTADNKPYYSTVNFVGGTNIKASVLITNDPGQVVPILQSGLGTGVADPSRTKKTEMTVRGLRVIRWDYVNPGDVGSGTKNHTEWDVIKSCNADTVYVINDLTLFNNFYLVDANGNESGTANFRLCSAFDQSRPYTEHREK